MGAQRRCVWVVDDSPLDGARAAGYLRTGYDVEVFSDGSAVLEHLASHAPPDVLVLDWVMPGISGPEVCRFIRASQKEAAHSVAILLLTGHQRTEQIVEGLSAGANDYLSKPYAEAELGARVAALVRSRELLARAELAERTLRLVLDSAPDALVVLDDTGRVSYANAESERTLSRSAATLVGTLGSELVPGFDASRAVMDSSSSEPYPDVSIGDEVFSPVVRRLPADEASRSATVSFRNVTAHRVREAKRLDLYAIVAHDLRSPLNAILLRADALVRGFRGALTERVLTDLHKIQKNVVAMVSLIDDFLELARLESPSHTLTIQPLDLVSLLASVSEDLQPLVDAANHRVVVTAPDSAIVRGNAARLTQVLMNLLTNAVKYTPNGGRISVTIELKDAYFETRIADNGPGIDPALLLTITDRYVRGTESSHQSTGSGLGLMIVRQILEAHGTALVVESHVGAGARFSFRLAAS